MDVDGCRRLRKRRTSSTGSSVFRRIEATFRSAPFVV